MAIATVLFARPTKATSVQRGGGRQDWDNDVLDHLWTTLMRPTCFQVSDKNEEAARVVCGGSVARTEQGSQVEGSLVLVRQRSLCVLRRGFRVSDEVLDAGAGMSVECCAGFDCRRFSNPSRRI